MANELEVTQYAKFTKGTITVDFGSSKTAKQYNVTGTSYSKKIQTATTSLTAIDFEGAGATDGKVFLYNRGAVDVSLSCGDDDLIVAKMKPNETMEFRRVDETYKLQSASGTADVEMLILPN